MEANKRIREIRYHLKLKQNDFAESLGLKQGSYSDVERGKNNLSNTVRQMLKEKYNINLTWLDKGEGQMFSKEPKESPPIFTQQDFHLITIINKLMEDYRKLAEENGALKERLSKFEK